MSFDYDSMESTIPIMSLDDLSGYYDDYPSESISGSRHRSRDPFERSSPTRYRSTQRLDDHRQYDIAPMIDSFGRCIGATQIGYRCMKTAKVDGYCVDHNEATDRRNLERAFAKQKVNSDHCRGVGNFGCRNRVERGFPLCHNCENSICPGYQGCDCSGPIVNGGILCEACLRTKRMRDETTSSNETQRRADVAAAYQAEAARRAEETKRLIAERKAARIAAEKEAARKAAEEMAAYQAEATRRVEEAKREAEAAAARKRAEEEAARQAAIDRDKARKAAVEATRKVKEKSFRFESSQLEQRFLNLSEKRRGEIAISINSFRLGSEQIGLSILGKRYREYARLHHPDRGGDEERFKAMGAHYEHLKRFLEE